MLAFSFNKNSMSNSPDNKKAVFPKPEMTRAFRIFCCTNPFLTEKYHNIQNSWAKRENSPKYGHGFWLSQIQNGIFGHFALGVSCLHGLMFLSCRNGISMAIAIAISVQVHSWFLNDSVVHDRCDLTRFFFRLKNLLLRLMKDEKGKVKKGAVRKMIKVVNSPL